MNDLHQPEQVKKQREVIVQAKTLLSATLGAIIGCGACLHTYYTLLGGADQVQRLSQIEITTEHNRQVSEQALAVLMQLQSNDVVTKKPIQRQLSDAIEGLFDGLPEDGGAGTQSVQAAAASGTSVESRQEKVGGESIDEGNPKASTIDGATK